MSGLSVDGRESWIDLAHAVSQTRDDQPHLLFQVLVRRSCLSLLEVGPNGLAKFNWGAFNTVKLGFDHLKGRVGCWLVGELGIALLRRQVRGLGQNGVSKRFKAGLLIFGIHWSDPSCVWIG
jgi:hypothetical protein